MKPFSPLNILYAQAGGVTPVINTTLAAVIETCQRHFGHIGALYGARNGILGVLHEDLVALTHTDTATLNQLKHLPGGALQACRFDLDTEADNPQQYERIYQVFKAHQIHAFLYNGGNGSMLTAQKVADYCARRGHPIQVIGIPKTIDNDLAHTHCSPGYGSAAKFFATSLLEAALDLRAMYPTSTKVFIMEAMGRHTGWIALSGTLITENLPDVPLQILFPERPFDYDALLRRVKQDLSRHDHCVIVVAEGLRTADGELFAVARPNSLHRDWSQLGGAGIKLADELRRDLDTKVHVAVPDYLQRSAAHMVSLTDWEMAYDVGRAAVEAVLAGRTGVLPVIHKVAEDPFEWHTPYVDISTVANAERPVPPSFIREDGYGATQAAIDYLRPLIAGERPVFWHHGLPDLRPVQFPAVDKRCPPWRHTP
ncbi:MAG TPA: 6-phosphofructokinase [Sulfurivirga caldicuralii]|nr:6-phosphofructokinase [Sulfurivirga caldicuralii]